MRIMSLRKITLAKLFGPKVPDRHLMGFAVVLNQGRRDKTFAQEIGGEINTSGLCRVPARLQEGICPSTSPCLVPCLGQPGHGDVEQEQWGGQELSPRWLRRAELWLSPESRAAHEPVFWPGTERG